MIRCPFRLSGRELQFDSQVALTLNLDLSRNLPEKRYPPTAQPAF